MHQRFDGHSARPPRVMKLDARPPVFGGRLSLSWSDRQYSGFRGSGDWIWADPQTVAAKIADAARYLVVPETTV